MRIVVLGRGMVLLHVKKSDFLNFRRMFEKAWLFDPCRKLQKYQTYGSKPQHWKAAPQMIQYR